MRPILKKTNISSNESFGNLADGLQPSESTQQKDHYMSNNNSGGQDPRNNQPKRKEKSRSSLESDPSTNVFSE